MSSRLTWSRRARRVRRYVAAFSLQLYLTSMFALFSVLRLLEPGGFLAGSAWPVAYVVTAAVLAAGIARPFSRRLAAGGGALIAVVGAARIVAVAELALRSEGGMPYGMAVAATLWGLVVIVGLRWPRIAWESGIRHLTDVGSPECAPPEPDYPPATGR